MEPSLGCNCVPCCCCVAVWGPGAVWSSGAAIRRPCGRVHWAGTEAATEGQGFMDGAVESGARAAAEVVDALQVRVGDVAVPLTALRQVDLIELTAFDCCLFGQVEGVDECKESSRAEDVYRDYDVSAAIVGRPQRKSCMEWGGIVFRLMSYLFLSIVLYMMYMMVMG